MKSATVILSLLAGLAQAGTQNHHANHLNYRRGNYTEPQTTLTVIATEVHTIISCAPTVTNCPADATGISALPESDKSTMVVTDTVVLTTTVCPAKDASSISSVVIGDHSATKTAVYTAPTDVATSEAEGVATSTIGYPTPTAVATSGAEGVATSDIVTEQTQTITVGTGTDASVITTTISKTTKITVTITESRATVPAAPTEEPTTTVTATRTSTTTITVAKPDATETASVTGQDVCGCTATVTVTAPASTVYVTMSNEPSQTAADYPNPTGADDGDDGEDDGADDDCDDDDETSAAVTTIQSTVIVVPYPTGGNGTVTSGYAHPTGFAKLHR